MNPKERGTSFETEVAKRLSRWYNPHDKVDYFWRTHGSGAVSTIRKTCDSLDGDIMPIREDVAELFKYVVIECKRRKDLDILTFIDKKGSNQILQLIEESVKRYKHKKHLFLIVRRDRGKAILVTPLDFTKIVTDYCVIGYDSKLLFLYPFETFLSCVSYEKIIEILKGTTEE